MPSNDSLNSEPHTALTFVFKILLPAKIEFSSISVEKSRDMVENSMVKWSFFSWHNSFWHTFYCKLFISLAAGELKNPSPNIYLPCIANFLKLNMSRKPYYSNVFWLNVYALAKILQNTFNKNNPCVFFFQILIKPMVEIELGSILNIF